MKKIILAITFYCSLFTTNCFSQGWEWVKLVQPFDNNSYMTVKVGTDGNVYGTGRFNQSIDLGNGHVLNGNQDAFVAKFDTAGLCQWAQKISVTAQGCGCTAQGNTSYAGLAGFDSNGNVIIYGGYCGCSEAFGSGITASNAGYNLFLAKYSPAGACLWAQTKPASMNIGTGQTFDYFYDVTTDNDGYIYVSLNNYATSTSLCGLNFPNQANYILKINPNGVGVWAFSTGVSYEVKHINYYGKRLYFSGYIAGTVTIGSATYTANGAADGVVIKADTAGNILSSTVISGPGIETPLALCTSNNKLCLLSQGNSSSVTIGTHTLSTTGSSDNTFLVSYDTNLNFKNCRNTANNSGGSGTALYNDAKGNIYVTVTNTATTDFGNLSSVPAGRHVIKMNDTLTNYWHMESVSTCVAPDTLGNLYIVDSFNGSANYGPFTNTSSGHGITLGKISNAYGVGLQSRAAQNNSLSVYPNPGDGLFNLKLDKTIKSKKGVSIILYDGTGKQIENVPFNLTDDYTLQINLSSYAKGLYMVKAEVDGILYSAKLER